MPALPPYIPPRDTDFNSWLANFSTRITATPMLYGLSPADAVNIAAVTAAWDAAYLLVTSPTTKTAAAVGAKNAQKVSTLAVVRVYAQQISLNPGVASGDKIGLGLNPRTSTPTPVTPPDSVPVLLVQAAGNLTVTLRYRDSAASPSVKSKPYGVLLCELRAGVSTVAPVGPLAIPFFSCQSKSPFIVPFAEADGGKQAYFAARWRCRNGGVSEFGPVISFTVPTSTPVLTP